MRQWTTAPVDESAAAELAIALGVPASIARALCLRGVTGADSAKQYLNPRLGDVSDPFGIAGMTAAVDRVWLAIDRQEPITAYGDFDVDGVTGSAVLTRVLRKLNARVEPFVPRRVEDGYGLTESGLNRCIETTSPKLIITADCGITAVEPVRLAATRGVDVIITDHHEPADELPPAVAVVNPKLGCPLSATWLSGVGVAFKLCHALVKGGIEQGRLAADAVDLREYLSLVAIGTVADVSPLLGENRVFVHHGLSRITRTAMPGLRALVEISKMKGPELDTHHVGFQIAPRINAAGRVGDALDALRLLVSEDESETPVLARKLDDANKERRRIEESIQEEACFDIEQRMKQGDPAGIVVGRSGWHIGTIGIVASRLCARYGKPVIVIGFDETGQGRGSCRSVEDLDMVGALGNCASHLIKFGGHKMAAGLSIELNQLDVFRAAFESACARQLKGVTCQREWKVDAWLDLADVDDALLGMIKKMSPFGEGNPKPLWGVRGLRMVGAPRIVGTNHLKATLSSESIGRRGVPAIGFGLGDRPLPDGPIDVLAHIEENEYMGRREIQLSLQDFRSSV